MMDKIIDCHMHFSAKGIFNKTNIRGKINFSQFKEII